MRAKQLTSILSSLFFVAACSKEQAPVAPQAAAPSTELRASELARDKAAFKESAPERGLDVQLYRLHARFDWQNRRLHGDLQIELKRQSNIQTVVLDSRVEKVLGVESAAGQALPFVVDAEKSELRIDVASLSGQDLVLRVRYESLTETGGAVRAVAPRSGDPLAQRVVYTHSEPQDAAYWMPSNDRPDDRARFAFSMDVNDPESVIANGRLVERKALGGGAVRWSYEIAHPIPTYLMAFAAGDFEHLEMQHGSLPVSVWVRRGYPADLRGVLKETVAQIKHFEKLMVPFPFEKYAMVLLPEFGGGEENASITFMDETRAGQSRVSWDLSLMAHELGHQWFGDLITVKTWDDLWIKEGMATLLGAEGMRASEDLNGRGHLMGDAFGPDAGDAVVDPKLAPDEKYTSGPYDRAAWVYTQLRATLGESVFWSILRKVLTEHAYGSIDTATFSEYFRPHLSAEAFARFQSALRAHALPTINFSQGNQIQVNDPENALIVDPQLQWQRADGSTRSLPLPAGQTVSYAPQAGEILLSSDPRDAHPNFSIFAEAASEEAQRDLNEKLYKEEFSKFLLPQDPAGQALFAKLNPASQSEGLRQKAYWYYLSATQFEKLWPSLGASTTRVNALALGCSKLKDAEPASANEWKRILRREFTRGPVLGFGSDAIFGDCATALPAEELFATEFSRIEQDPENVDEAWVQYLRSFRHPLKTALPMWGMVAQNASATRAREASTKILSYELSNNRAGENAELAAATTLRLRAILAESSVGRVVAATLPALKSVKDVAALPVLADKVQDMSIYLGVRVNAVCAAFSISGGSEESGDWKSFKSSLPIDELEPRLRGLLQAPARGCATL